MSSLAEGDVNGKVIESDQAQTGETSEQLQCKESIESTTLPSDSISSQANIGESEGTSNSDNVVKAEGLHQDSISTAECIADEKSKDTLKDEHEKNPQSEILLPAADGSKEIDNTQEDADVKNASSDIDQHTSNKSVADLNNLSVSSDAGNLKEEEKVEEGADKEEKAKVEQEEKVEEKGSPTLLKSDSVVEEPESKAVSNEDKDQSSDSVGGWTKEERDLPAPPPPIKEKESVSQASLDSDEVSKIARAFGVSTSLQESPAIEKNAQISSSTLSKSDGLIDTIKANQVASTSSDTQNVTTSVPDTPSRKNTGILIGKGPPPTTPASEEKPFDFNRFLDQMRHRSAGPVGEYVRSFIKGFTKKPYRVADQTKLILDFLDFISLRMRECEVWTNVSSVEFENATEAMEKLIMNRLYNYTFSPAIKREGKWSVQTDDLERDRVLKQRIRLFGWIDESHLDVPVGDHSKGFIDFAIQELLKINHYKAPRDKVICILNCCKVIFGLIRHLSTQENADNFVPILIFVVLRANPDNLISNVEYISRFRNPDKLSSESGYYLSSLMGAIAFIETMDYTSLSNITQKEFETNVEEAVQQMSTQPESAEPFTPVKFDTGKEGYSNDRAEGGESSSAPASMQMTPQGSSSGSDDPNRSLPISAGAAALAKDTKAFIQRTGEAARLGIGASFGGSMNALGRLFQDGLDGPRPSSSPSSGVVSGRDTPESGVGPGTGTTNSARARMWNLFGADDDHHTLAQRQQQQLGKSSLPALNLNAPESGSTTRPEKSRNVSTPSLNFGSWSRAMRSDVDSEPPTPQSEELKQGRFAPLSIPGQPATSVQQNTPLSERLARSFEARTPVTPNVARQPLRQGSTDPYLLDGEGGVRTPTDDGSDVGENHLTPQHFTSNEQSQQQLDSNVAPNITRSRRSDLSSYLPSFFSEANVLRTPQTQASALPSQQNDPIDQEHFQSQHARLRQLQHSPVSPTPQGYRQDDERIAEAAAQIDRAHVDAGVETLKSIFPDTESSVCRLVLEGCDGNVQQAIDKLLEMA